MTEQTSLELFCNNSETTSEYYKAILPFHKLNIVLKRDKEAVGQGGKKRKYVTLDNIMETVRPLLADCDIIIEQHYTGKELITKLVHCPSGQWVGSACPFTPMQGQGTNSIQNDGGGITYLRRYTVAAMLALCSEEDNDGESKKAPPIQAQLPQKPKTVMLIDSKAFTDALDYISKGTFTVQDAEKKYVLSTDVKKELLAAEAKYRKEAGK